MSMVTAFYEGKRLRAESDERDRQAEEAKQFRAASAGIVPVQNDPGDGMGPSAVMVGKQAFASDGSQGRDEATGNVVAPGAAQAAADAYNKPEAKIARQMGVLMDQGKTGDAMALEKTGTDMQDFRSRRAKALEAEGISQFVDDNLGAAPDVTWVKSNPGSTFDLANVDQFNKTGGRITIPAGSKGRWKTMDMGDGREIVDFEVIDPAGKPYPSAHSARTLQWLQQMGAAGVEKEAAARHKAGQEAQFKRDELTSLDNYRKGIVEASQTRADKTGSGGGGSGSAYERMPEHEKLAYQAAVADTKEIQSAIIKAQAEPGAWDPQQNPGQFSLLQQLEVARRRATGIMSKYSDQPGGEQGQRPDPYGIRSNVDRSSPPSFDVKGDPAAFRKKLAGKVDASVLAAFDAQYPQAQKKVAQTKPVASAGILPPSGPASKAQALREAQAAANAYRPPVDLRAKVASQGKAANFTDEDLGVLNLINGRK